MNVNVHCTSTAAKDCVHVVFYRYVGLYATRMDIIIIIIIIIIMTRSVQP